MTKKKKERQPEDEKWLPIEGYEGIYEVSNLGKVRSLDRNVTIERGTRSNLQVYTSLRKGKELTPCVESQGYRTVSLYKGGGINTVRIHRLIATAFHSNKERLPEVNHKDEDKTNNRADNLEWCSRLYNINYGTGTERSVQGRIKPVYKLSLNGEILDRYPSVRSVKVDGYDAPTVSNCCNGKYATHYGFKWRFVND